MFLLSLLQWRLIVRERVIRRGVLLAAIVAASTVVHAQEAQPSLKPTVLDDLAVEAETVPALKPIIVAEPEEPVVPRKKKIVVDPYAPTGINTGVIRLYPTFEIGTVASSNVAQSNTNPKFDFGLKLKPSISFATDWSRHSWTGAASAEILHYLNNPDLSTVAGSASTNFRLDIRHTTHADFAANIALNDTGLGDSSLPAAALVPRRDKNFGISADLVHDFGGLEGSVKTALARSVYDDVPLKVGPPEKNADRNYTEPSLTLRATLGNSAARLRPYAEVQYAPRFHDQIIDDNGQKRDSQGFSGTLGVTLNDGPFWQGDVALAYLVRSYADPAFATTSALGLRGRLEWSPMALLKIDAITGVDLGETANLGVGGTRNWNVGLNATYSLRDNVNLLAGIGLTRSDIGTQTTTSKTATAGFEWTLNPNMSAAVTYQGNWYDDGTAAGSGNYNEQRLMTSIILKR
jgi:hypothetical protein